MRTRNWLLALAAAVALVLPTWRAFGDEDKPVKPVQEWKGSLDEEKDEPLMQEAPKDGFIATNKAWAKLWKAWRGDEKLPRINFAKQLVLVGVTSCSRNQLSGSFQLDESGDLKTRWAATLIAGPGFSYRICVVDRDGVQSVDGKAIGKN